MSPLELLAVLPFDLRESFERIASTLGISESDPWPPGLRQTLELAAVLHYVGRMDVALPRRTRFAAACRVLRLNSRTLEKRFDRLHSAETNCRHRAA